MSKPDKPDPPPPPPPPPDPVAMSVQTPEVEDSTKAKAARKGMAYAKTRITGNLTPSTGRTSLG
jgi:hypothetical protein